MLTVRLSTPNIFLRHYSAQKDSAEKDGQNAS
jgi:hypothetical protein